MQQQNEEVLIETNEQNLTVKYKVENELILIKNLIAQIDTVLNVTNNEQHEELKDFMKKYIKGKENISNKEVEFNQIIYRGAKDSSYQYREVLYIIVKIQDANQQNLEAKAFEVDQIYDKKSNKLWKVNRKLTLDEISHNLKLEYDELKKADQYFTKFKPNYKENFKNNDSIPTTTINHEQSLDSYFN